MTASLEDAYRVDRVAWVWLLGRIWATHVATGRAWLRALCRPALVAFVALFALTLPTAHLHGSIDWPEPHNQMRSVVRLWPVTGAQRHIAVHWHGLPLLDAVLATGQPAAHHHAHTLGRPVRSEAPVGAAADAEAGPRASPAATAPSEQRQTSPWHAMSAGSPALTYLHSVLPLPQPVLAMLDYVWSVDGFWPPDVPIPPPETPPRVLLTTE